jgi:hypothetical protein
VHERLDEAELLAVPLRELADRAVEDDTEPLAELGSKLPVDRAANTGERVELLVTRQSVGEAEVTRQVADLPVCLDRCSPRVDTEDRRAAGSRSDQPEQEPDGGALARPVGPQVAEHLAALDAEVEVDQRANRLVVRLREGKGLDRRGGGHPAPIVVRARLGTFSGPVRRGPAHAANSVSTPSGSRRPLLDHALRPLDAGVLRPAVCRPGRPHRCRTSRTPPATGCSARLPRGRAGGRTRA